MAENPWTMMKKNYDAGAFKLDSNKKFPPVAPGEVPVDPNQLPLSILLGGGGPGGYSSATLPGPVPTLGVDPTQNQSIDPTLRYRALSNIDYPSEPAPVQDAKGSLYTGGTNPYTDLGFTPYYQRKQYKDLMDATGRAREEASKLQQGSVSDSENLLNAYKAMPGQMNLAPLGALVDTWTGSKLSSGYQKPDSASDRFKIADELQKSLLKARSGLTESQSTYLRDQIKAMQDQDNTMANLINATANRDNAKANKTVTTDLAERKHSLNQRESYTKEHAPVVQGLTQMVTQLNIIKQLTDANGGKRLVATDAGFPQYKQAASKLVATYNNSVGKFGALAGADLRLIQSALGVSDENALNAIDNLFSSPADSRAALNQLMADLDMEMAARKRKAGRVYEANSGVPDVFAEDEAAYNNARGPAGPTREQKERAAEEIRRRNQGSGTGGTP